MKTIVINELTARALNNSIKHWETIVSERRTRSGGAATCALCSLFNISNNPEPACRRCPIALDTNQIGCGGTPYYAFTDGRNMQGEAEHFARLELDYLRNLQERCVILVGADNHVLVAPPSIVIEPQKPGIYLILFHGRDTDDEDMPDWGFEGPMIGPLPYGLTTTYAREVKFVIGRKDFDTFFPRELPSFGWDVPRQEAHHGLLMSKGGCLIHGGKFYGDWSVRWLPKGDSK